MTTPRIVVVCGATASRKSELAIALAEHLNGELVCCDSVQVYRGLVIGSAGPTDAERARVPHHLYGVMDPHDGADAGRYARMADAAIAAITIRMTNGMGRSKPPRSMVPVASQRSSVNSMPKPCDWSFVIPRARPR